MELKEYLLALIERATSGSCDDTDLLCKYKEKEMSCADVETIISAFWVAFEEEYRMDVIEERIIISKIVQNIIENMK